MPFPPAQGLFLETRPGLGPDHVPFCQQLCVIVGAANTEVTQLNDFNPLL